MALMGIDNEQSGSWSQAFYLGSVTRIEEDRTIAKSLTIKSNHLPKTDLIKSIQYEEGRFDFHATAYGGKCD